MVEHYRIARLYFNWDVRTWPLLLSLLRCAQDQTAFRSQSFLHDWANLISDAAHPRFHLGRDTSNEVGELNWHVGDLCSTRNDQDDASAISILDGIRRKAARCNRQEIARHSPGTAGTR